MIKLVAVCALGLFAVVAKADLTEVTIDNTWFSGKIFTFPIPNPSAATSGEGGSTMNMVPVSFYFNRKASIVYPGGFTTSIKYVQTKIFVMGTNQFLPITPRTIYALSTVVSKANGSDSGTNAADDYAASGLLRALRSAPYNTPDYQFGKFKFVVDVLPTGGSWSEAIGMEFIMSPIGIRDWANGGGGNPDNPFQGGGIGPDDLNNQNINQGGFWEGIFEGLFIPSEETLTTLRDTLMQWANWGPFGIITYLHTRSEEYREGSQMDYAFDVNLPMVGTTEFDLTPWQVAVKIGRSIGAGFMWLVVIGGIWKKLHSKV